MQFRQFLLTESKQEIVRLGYPEIIAQILQKHFDKNAYLIARWFIEYRFGDREVPGNWWLQVAGNLRDTSNLFDLTYLYAATKSPEAYDAALKKLDLSLDAEDSHRDEYYLADTRKELAAQIEDRFFNETFFINSIIKDIKDGKLTNLAPYKKMLFWSAEEAYDKKRIFDDKKPIKTYSNGYKWIDAGRRCHLVGNQMKHCGSVGIMSMDKNATMLTLFSPENKAHVTVTYSPNERRISGDVGVGSSAVKPEYHPYVLDLAQMLNAEFDVIKSKSKFLGLKYQLRNKASNVERLDVSSVYDEYFRFTIDRQEYYTNGYEVVTKADLIKFKQAVSQGSVKLNNNGINVFTNLFHHYNRDVTRKLGINYTPIQTFTLS